MHKEPVSAPQSRPAGPTMPHSTIKMYSAAITMSYNALKCTVHYSDGKLWKKQIMM